MPEPDSDYLFIFLLLLYIILMFFIEYKKSKDKLFKEYMNKLTVTKTKCVLYCRYLFGIDKLNENTL